MTVIKSYSVKLTDTLKGDMFTIKHGSDNFTIIDCCLSEDDKDTIIQDIKLSSKDKKMRRFISTHPDEDHIRNLDYLDDKMHISNFYCVKNNATKKDESDSFKRYCELRDSSKACFLEKNITRKWLNLGDSQRGSSGISIKWPIVENEHFKKAESQNVPLFRTKGQSRNGEIKTSKSQLFGTFGVVPGLVLGSPRGSRRGSWGTFFRFMLDNQQKLKGVKQRPPHFPEN